eukprot:TRINITY_DN6086_c3_g1_i1.p1 TRINITY_DN6086_c3_g1~~TRINITY_DN6086_c3_g1_i1.p1  ORF type:complete len:135 (+),score=22.75 TRINITY_DN6086_c3_g1_i1:58-462(+)
MSMRSIHNEKVVKTQAMSRPIEAGDASGKADKIGRWVGSHSGTVVTTDKGNNYLVHKTPGAGTVVTDAPMSKKWQKVGAEGKPPAGTTVSSMVKAGGKDYRGLSDNCNHATSRMPGSTVSGGFPFNRNVKPRAT